MMALRSRSAFHHWNSIFFVPISKRDGSYLLSLGEMLFDDLNADPSEWWEQANLSITGFGPI